MLLSVSAVLQLAVQHKLAFSYPTYWLVTTTSQYTQTISQQKNLSEMDPVTDKCYQGIRKIQKGGEDVDNEYVLTYYNKYCKQVRCFLYLWWERGRFAVWWILQYEEMTTYLSDRDSRYQLLEETVLEYYPQADSRAHIKILDLAAGTGLVGEILYKCGFRCFDAVDASEGMLAGLAKKGI